MLSRQAKKFVVAEIREVEAAQAVMLVAINTDEYFYSLAPLHFLPRSAREVGKVVWLTWEFIPTLDQSNARVVAHNITPAQAKTPAMMEAMKNLIEVKLRLGLVREQA